MCCPRSKAQRLKRTAIAGPLALVFLTMFACLFACSGGGVNLADMVGKPPSEVANVLKGQKEVVVGGSAYYTNDENYARKVYEGSVYEEDLSKYRDCYALQLLNSSGVLSLEKIDNGSNPTRAECELVISDDKLSAKDVADRVTAVAPYDKVVAYAYSADGTIAGMSKGNGCVSDFYARKLNGAWMLSITTYSISEDSSGSIYSDDFDDEYEDFDVSNYADSYKR